MPYRTLCVCLLALLSSVALQAQTCEGIAATIVGTEGDDHLLGTAGDDVIVGLGGNDLIESADGNDTLCGGDGNDILIAGQGNDRLFGDAGNDDLRGETGKDHLDGGPDNDGLRGGPGDDDLTGQTGDDALLGETGADQCDGVSGIDSADSACETTANLDADVLFLTLYAPDGTRLDGELYVPTNDAATLGTREVAWVIRHGAQGTYANGVNQLAGLWGISRGFTVLSLNGRDWGPAAGGGNTLFEDTTLDMAVGIDFLERAGFNKVFVAGHSGGTQAAGVYPALGNNDPRMVAVGLFGVVADGRVAATKVLFLPASLYADNLAKAHNAVAEGRGQEIEPYPTTFGIDLQRSGRTFLSYWGPDSRSVVFQEITAAKVPVFILRAAGDGFTPDAYSRDVRDAAVAAGVDATYVEIPYPGPVGGTGVNAHSLIGVERTFMDETTNWLLAKVPAAANFISSRPARVAGNYLPLAEAGKTLRVVTVGGEPMTLDGRNSVDLDGTLVQYAWTQTGGKAVTLRNANTPMAGFDVPGASSTLRFALEVTDDQGATATDTVTVEVASLNPGGGGSSADLVLLACLTILATARWQVRRRTAASHNPV